MDSEYRILGELEVLQNGDPIPLGYPGQRALLARLLITRGDVVSTDRLLDDLWRDEPPDASRHTLHVYVSRLRKALGPDRDRLERRGAGYRMDVAPDELDADRFERLAAEGRSAHARGDPTRAGDLLREALGLWRGPVLADFADEDFVRGEAARLAELRLAVLEERIWADLEAGKHAEPAEELRDLTARHPFREVFWEQLMLALYRCGRQAEALRVFQKARATLAEELGIAPGPALRRMEERILAQDPELDFAPTPDTAAPPAGLPLQRTSFIGRQRELSRGAELLGASRLLTLTGAPGSGKTRLALRLAAHAADGFTHGAVFVPLAAITDPALLESTIARNLGLRKPSAETVMEALIAFLRKRHLLVVLDNLEQLLPAAPRVGELLDAAPGLTIIATSRAPLGLSAEQEFRVPPLSVPPHDAPADPELLAGFDAVALFLARARTADPDFALTDDNAGAVAGIAAQLDGLPLAIELAAARTRLLTPQELRDRLAQRLPLLTGGPIDAERRHLTMRDAIAWSCGLLEDDEQAVFRRLGVFRGGFTLDAAAAVAEPSVGDVPAAIESLLAKSLLQRPVHVGRARFGMLELIREFAREQLDATGEAGAVAARHARYFRDLAAEVEPQLSGAPGGSTATELDLEVDNLRAALGYALDTDDPDLGLALAGSIWRYWQSAGLLTEGREWLEKLLGHPQGTPPARAAGLTALAGLAYWHADYDEALRRYAEALELYRSRGDRRREADTLCDMSLCTSWMRELERGERLAAEALSTFEGLDDRAGIAKALMARATALWFGGEIPAARDLWVESLDMTREAGNQALALTMLVGLSGLTFHLGDRREALRLVLAGIDEAVEVHNTHIAVWMLDVAGAFAAPDAPAEAVRLAGAAAALREEAGGGILASSLDIADARSAAGDALDPTEVEAAWTAGRSLSLEQGVDLARDLGERLLEH